MSAFKKMKIRIYSPEHSIQIQNRLLDLGYQWPGGKFIQFTGMDHLYTSLNVDGQITCNGTGSEQFFTDCVAQLTTLEDLLSEEVEKSQPLGPMDLEKISVKAKNEDHAGAINARLIFLGAKRNPEYPTGGDLFHKGLRENLYVANGTVEAAHQNQGERIFVTLDDLFQMELETIKLSCGFTAEVCDDHFKISGHGAGVISFDAVAKAAEIMAQTIRKDNILTWTIKPVIKQFNVGCRTVSVSDLDLLISAMVKRTG